MKKLITVMLTLVFIGIYDVSTAQGREKDKAYFTMQGGKMMIVKNGESKMMTEDKVLNDGTKITTSGMIVMSDGTSRNLAEGEKIYKHDHVKKDKSKMKEKRSMDKM